MWRRTIVMRWSTSLPSQEPVCVSFAQERLMELHTIGQYIPSYRPFTRTGKVCTLLAYSCK